MQLRTLTEEFLLAYKGIYSPNTVSWYESRFIPLLKNLGHKEISEITITDLRKLYVKLVETDVLYKDHPYEGRKPIKKNYSKQSLHAFARSWKRLFNWAVEERYIDKTPAARLSLPQLPDPDPKAVSPENITLLLEAVKKYSTNPIRDYAIIRFLASTNARVSGAASLTLQKLDAEQKIAEVHEKGKGGNGKARPVFLDPNAAEAMEAWIKKRPASDDERVFMLAANGIAQMLNRMAAKINLKDPHNPHAFRHGFAKGVLGQGANLAQVSQLMGHSDSAITVKYYGQFATKELQEFHNRYLWVPDDKDKKEE